MPNDNNNPITADEAITVADLSMDLCRGVMDSYQCFDDMPKQMQAPFRRLVQQLVPIAAKALGIELDKLATTPNNIPSTLNNFLLCLAMRITP